MSLLVAGSEIYNWRLNYLFKEKSQMWAQTGREVQELILDLTALVRCSLFNWQGSWLPDTTLLNFFVLFQRLEMPALPLIHLCQFRGVRDDLIRLCWQSVLELVHALRLKKTDERERQSERARASVESVFVLVKQVNWVAVCPGSKGDKGESMKALFGLY